VPQNAWLRSQLEYERDLGDGIGRQYGVALQEREEDKKTIKTLERRLQSAFHVGDHQTEMREVAELAGRRLQARVASLEQEAAEAELREEELIENLHRMQKQNAERIKFHDDKKVKTETPHNVTP